MEKRTVKIGNKSIPVFSMNTIVVGSGAASLSCADHIYNMGQKDLAIITEKVGGGTSNNTGSDKQTYYKLSVFGKEGDCPYEMAKSLYDGGCMHGDLALIESLCSAQGFYRLVDIGVPFPHNQHGGFVGYKTDHDPRQRATSAGPWTSNQMFQCLLKQVQNKKIAIFDEYEVVSIITDKGRACGIVAIDKKKIKSPSAGIVLFQAENVVFGVGGPGGLYKTSVYPKVHTGAIGIALEAGAKATNLTESQYGLASTKFRWNVSGTYQQVIPRYISTDTNGKDEQEFLNPYYRTMGKLNSSVFLKGYQWPFDSRKIPDYGSSLIDILVYIETVVRGRKVFMDFRKNPVGNSSIGSFRFEDLDKEAYSYLEKSNALFGTPIERLKKMNPMAIELYKKHGIDITKEPLEVAVCAQHNNGGLLGDVWWESNISHLFPVGEVNGSHGVYRPGGSALNSGQVGALRAAQRIVKAYGKKSLTAKQFDKAAAGKVTEVLSWVDSLKKSVGKTSTVKKYRDEFQSRMSECAAHIRELGAVEKALSEAYKQINRFSETCIKNIDEIPEALKNRQLAIAHAAYIEAVLFYLCNGGGSRGSYMVMDSNAPEGSMLTVLPGVLDEWRYKAENVELRSKMLETVYKKENGRYECRFTDRRPLPEEDYWFENVWGDFVKGNVFK